MLGSASTWGNRQSRKCNIFKRISLPSENTKWTINMNFIHNKVWSKVSQVQRLLQQPHAFLLLRCHTHTFTFHFGSQTFILDIASHFSNDLTTNLYRGSSWLGRNRALEVIKMSICIQITQKKNKKMQKIHYLQNICPFFKWACYKIFLNFLIIILMTRNIVIKAIDLWCKPDTPEDNFEEDGSGWGSGDEVFVFLILIIFHNCKTYNYYPSIWGSGDEVLVFLIVFHDCKIFNDWYLLTIIILDIIACNHLYRKRLWKEPWTVLLRDLQPVPTRSGSVRCARWPW